MKRKRLDELQQFPLPKNCRQRRSGGTKPRTEFVDSAWSSSGSSLETLICKDDMTTKTASLCQEICHPAVEDKKQMKRFDPVHSILEDGAEIVPFANLSSNCLPEVESVSQKKLFSNTNNRSKEQDSDGKFDADFSSKVFDGTPDRVKQEIDGSEGVQALCGNISADSFLDWAKTTDMLRTPLQLHESPAVASGSASCSSRSEEDCDKRGRGKRKRKPKLHFDETTFSAKSVKKLRRLRIMRYLGLVAPPGSPFSADAHVKTDCRSRRVLKA
ncbi:uncharacterized protein LOC116252176 isoform X2 [Nymphaea colorata]|uniref:uncharacterized protein LOC116252176 isoform X2 n=1 Tax=Nymphaea colorata TaxID=210225 RepID=UPI00129E8015|nr:uncharacterized protein LOC116252176 isoform X2 [Nymphaea colorata]